MSKGQETGLFYICPIHKVNRPGICPAIFLKGLNHEPFGCAQGAWTFWHKQEKRGHHHTKTDVVVPVVRVVPVAIRTAEVPVIIVERTAAHHAVMFGHIPATAAEPRIAIVLLFSSLRAGGRFQRPCWKRAGIVPAITSPTLRRDEGRSSLYPAIHPPT